MPRMGVEDRAAPELPGYVIGERLGAGGFGAVWRARHAVIEREVAIKVLHDKYSADPEAVARFVAEARAVNRISHPGIVEIFDFGTLADGRHYCVMELVRGRTLRDVLRERGSLPLAEAIPLLHAIAEAIDAAHAAGIAHRDLKPDNVFVTDRGGIKVIDFGLAKLTREQDVPVTETGAVFGTPQYMSPEQCRGKGVTLSTDAYSFGVVAYHVLAGKPPFTGDALELALHHLNDPPPPSGLAPSVERVLLELLAKDPERRPRSLPAAVAAMTDPRRAPRSWRRRGLLLAGFAIAAGAGVLYLQGRAGEDWQARPIALAAPQVVSLISVSPDASTLLMRDDGGNLLRRPLTGGIPTPVALPEACTGVDSVSTFPDGRLALTCVDGQLWSQSKSGAGWQRIASAEVVEVSPDGATLAIRRGQAISLLDAATGATRALGAANVNGMRWSPDGTRLVWSRQDETGRWRVEVVEVANGAVTALPIKPMLAGTAFQVAVFSDDEHIVYCGDSPSNVEVPLRERSLRDGHETVLARLPASPRVGTCNIGISRAPRRIVVATIRSTTAIAEYDPVRAAWNPIVDATLPDGRELIPVALSPDRKSAIAVVAPPSTWRTTLPEVRPTTDIELASIDLATGKLSPASSCPHTHSVVRAGNEVLSLDWSLEGTDAVIRLRAPGSCDVRHEWRLRGRPGWSIPVCDTRTCISALIEGGEAAVMKLPLDGSAPTELGRVPARTPGGAGIALSPDGSEVAVVPPEGNIVTVLPIAGGAPRTWHAEGALQSVTWPATDQLLVSGYEFTGGMGLLQFDHEGAFRHAWTDLLHHVVRLLPAPEGTPIVGMVRTYSNDGVVLSR